MPSVNVNGFDLYYADDDFADPWKPHDAVLMQHFVFGNHTEFRPWVPTLARELRVLRLDRRGSGLSAKPGLDYHYNYSDAETQQAVFREQLQIAEALQLPVVLHTREAEEDTLRILEEHPVSRKGVAHSFTGSQEMADALLAMGWFIGINGIVTFKNAEALRKVVHSLPLDRLLLETDAPYLTPVPFRGKPNSPAQVPVIAEFLAEDLGIPVAQLAAQTSENARRLFALPA